VSSALDVNILLYASDTSSEYHAKASSFLNTLITSGEACYVAWVTIMSYLRIATHARIFAAPLSPDEARANIHRLLSRPNIRTIAETDGFWRVYQEVAGAIPVRGNLVPDAHLAALLKQHGIYRLYTRDRDFLKFGFLKVIDPIVAP